MKEQIKQRWIGGMVLAAIFGIFLPLLFHDSHPAQNLSLPKQLPAAPAKPSVSLQLPQTIQQPAQQMAEQSTQTTTTTTAKSTYSLDKALQPPQAWVVQLASFSSQANANRLMKQLRQSGFDAYSRKITQAEKQAVVKVFIGPELSRDKAQKMQQQLEKQFHLKGLVRQYELV